MVRRLIPYLLIACYVPGLVHAQDAPRLESWAAGLEQFGQGRGAHVPMPGQDCPLSGLDSLALVSPISAMFHYLYINGTQVQAPTTPDTIRVAVKRVACNFLPQSGTTSLSGLVLERDGVNIIYKFGMTVSGSSSLGGVRYIRGADLEEPAWNGHRLIDQAWRDSVAAAAEAREADALEQRIQEAKERMEMYRRLGWPDRFAREGAMGRVVVGMNAEMVSLIWGRPARINTTATATGKTEQWVYGLDRYVYFEKGRVSAVQTSEVR